MARKAQARDWGEADLSVNDVQLDVQNPRIDIPAKASQPKIREMLFETEDIVHLAKLIVDADGLLPGERIIVIRDGNRLIALEGNRRVCACQVLIDPALAPKAYRKKLPPTTSALQAKLGTIKAEIAPSRDAAEVTITRRHTSPGVKQWSPVAKQRRIVRLIRTGKSALQVAEQLGMTLPQVRKSLREANLLEHVKNLPCWNQEEAARLKDGKLQTNPFTRFFTLKDAKSPLGLSFDKEDQVRTTIPSKNFDKAMEQLARELLLRTEGSADTRAQPKDVYHKVFAGNPELQNLLKNARPTTAGKPATGGTNGGTDAGRHKGPVRNYFPIKQMSAPGPSRCSSATILGHHQLGEVISDRPLRSRPRPMIFSIPWFATLLTIVLSA